MRLPGQTKRAVMAVVGVTVAAMAGGAPAQASDASLRKAITQQERRLAPLTEEFSEAVRMPTSAVGIARFNKVLERLQSNTRKYRTAVVKQQATTQKVKRGRTQFLAGLDSFAKAIRSYRAALDSFDPERPGAEKPAFRRAATQLKSANTRLDRAGKVIGVRR
ncbi:MAG: hypothetical protein M3417_13060 [Actinomycetota bacterium]|nr:hypothetical protein [Actinomycetota bacterium]